MTLQEEERPLTDAGLEMLFPSVPWRDPIRISDFDGDFGFACRFCIARHGIRGCDCMSSEHFGQLAWQFKRMSGSSGLKVQAAMAC